MVDIPVKRRQSVPGWVWIVVGLLAVLIALALIDYFVTNLVLNRGTGPGQDRPVQPFGPRTGIMSLFMLGVFQSLTNRS